MSPKTEDVYLAALDLSPEERAELVDQLIKSLPARLSRPSDPNWNGVSNRRFSTYNPDEDIPF